MEQSESYNSYNFQLSSPATDGHYLFDSNYEDCIRTSWQVEVMAYMILVFCIKSERREDWIERTRVERRSWELGY